VSADVKGLEAALGRCNGEPCDQVLRQIRDMVFASRI